MRPNPELGVMKMRVLTVLIVLVAGLFSSVVNSANIEPGYRESLLGIHVGTPPAYIYVVDEQGRRSGADLTRETFPAGGDAHAVQDIPHSVAMAPFISGGPREGTGEVTPWEIRIFDGGAQTYILHVVGIAAGISKPDLILFAPPWRSGGERDIRRYMAFLVRPGLEREVRVTVDISRDVLETVRVSSTGILEASVAIASQLGLVSSPGICQSLNAKISAAGAALNRGNRVAERGALRAFLNELKAQGGKHVQEPALTILREEAEALLNTPPPTPKPKKPKAGK
jgi:hypothetical protein